MTIQAKSQDQAKAAPINKVYKPLYTSNKRYYLVTGGRGSLKSSTVHDFIARLTYQRGHGILFTRYTMAAAELSIIPEFKITLDRLGITGDFHITNKVITNKRTGSFIYFSGIKTSSGDQTGKLKSIAGITTWVIEEGEDFTDEKAFDTIDDSIRTTAQQNRVIWIQNPTTREHFIYKRWIDGNSRQVEIDGYNITVSNHDQVEHIHTTYKIAERQGYLSRDWLFKAESSYRDAEELVFNAKRTWTKTDEELDIEIHRIRHSSYYYYNYIGGWLERAEGVIFDNWIEGEFDAMIPSVYGMDYGYSPDPLALVRVAVDRSRKRIYLKQYIYETHLDDVPGRLAMINDLQKRDLIVADTNEPRTTNKIDRAGFNIVDAKKEMIVDDIREIKTYLIVVDPDSKDIKTELNNYVWNDKKASIPTDKFNHALDAARYGFRRLVLPKKRGVRLKN